jgi:hypothetical protein
MTRNWPVPRLPGAYTRKPTFLQRQQSALHRTTRLRLQATRDAALVELAQIDRQLDGLSERRIALLDELEAARDRLWPAVPVCKGRRPPSLDASPMPPVPVDARWARGRGLRGLCLTILGRHGALGLADLHALIHRYGYGIDSPHPVKALADAMGYEVREGRAVRVSRGVYDLAEDGRMGGFRRGCDPRKGSSLGPLLPWSEGPMRDGLGSDDVDWADVPADPEERTDPARWIPDEWPDADPDDPSGGRDTGPLPPRDPALTDPTPAPMPDEPRLSGPPPGGPAPPDPDPPPAIQPVGTDSAQIRSRASAEGGHGAEGDRAEGGGMEGGGAAGAG